MSVNYAELRRLAQEATPGPWTWWNLEGEDKGWSDNGPNLETVKRGPAYSDGTQGAADLIVSAWGHDAWGIDVDPANAAYLAAVSPDVILDLLDRLDAAQA